jgi:hypothetical protein
VHKGFADLSLTTWVQRQETKKIDSYTAADNRAMNVTKFGFFVHIT